MGWGRGSSLRIPPIDRGLTLRLERTLPSEHFVDERAKREDIRPSVHGLAFELPGSEVLQRAEDRPLFPARPALGMTQTEAPSGFRRRNSSGIFPTPLAELRQLGVFRFGLLEDRDVGVGVFPEGEEILVGSLCLGLFSRHSERSAELQARHCTYGIADNDPAVIKNFLEFRGGFGALAPGQIGRAAHIDRIEGPDGPNGATALPAQLIRSSRMIWKSASRRRVG